MGKLNYGTTGISYKVEEVKLNTQGAPRCPRCNDRVYFNEEKRALGKSWHVRCFNCAKCHKRLDSTNCSEHDGEVYCAMCYKREFGPKGYGFAGGAAGLSTESSVHNVRPIEEGVTSQPVASILPSTVIDHSNPDCCPRCGRKVYFAEEVKALQRKWHRLCFKCGECNKLLEPGRCNGREGQLLCQGCYGRKHGLKGYGYAGGAGQLLSCEPEPVRRSLPPRREWRELGPQSIVGTSEWTDAIYL